jgi:hypothetical protein
VFVSYSRRDFYAAEEIAVELGRRGLAPWFDVHELAPGTDWSAAIDRAVAECDVLLLVATPAALASEQVRRERDLASSRGRPSVAVLPRPLRSPLDPGLPTYDLTTGFRRGVDRLAADLAAGRTPGLRRRIPLPSPIGVLLLALPLALSVVLAAWIAIAFAASVPGRAVTPDATTRTALAIVGEIAAVVAVAAGYVLWAFATRRVRWLNLRGWVFGLPLLVIVMAGSVDTVTEYVRTGAISSSADVNLSDWIDALAAAVALLGVAAAVATERSGGVYRHLRTGVAPARLRRRRTGNVAARSPAGAPARTYRLLAVPEDASVAEDVRRSLAVGGIVEVAADAPRDRDVVVVTDRTPVEWLVRTDLEQPLAVVGTSTALPVRGALQRLQWVDYRRRRAATLDGLARALHPDADEAARALAAAVPEGLEQPQAPRLVVLAEWVFYATASLAAFAGVYTTATIVTDVRGAPPRAAVLCALVAPVAIAAALRIRTRRLSRRGVLSAFALLYTALFALQFDEVLQAQGTADAGLFRSPTVAYLGLGLAVLAVTWRALGRWLPRGAARHPDGATLGGVRESRTYLAFVVPAMANAALAATGSFAASAPPADIFATPNTCHYAADAVHPVTAANAAITATPRAQWPVAVWRRVTTLSHAVVVVRSKRSNGPFDAELRRQLLTALDAAVLADTPYVAGTTTTGAWGVKVTTAWRSISQVFSQLQFVC